FVTEDFLTDKQVKNDRYRNPNSAPIIKTNQLRRFTTGIYDYSVMSSVFTPTDVTKFPHTQKVTMSAQDWCGQTFAQLNYEGGQNWRSQHRSYFEAEGDEDITTKADWLEDELFNRLRMGPEGLPTGEQLVLPPLAFLRLTHKPVEASKANTQLSDYEGDTFSGENLRVYTLEYKGLDRKLEIVFEAEAPYKIQGWTESYPSFGRTLTTTARLKSRVLEPYWQQNSPEYAKGRAELGLSGFGD
ncbi:MAG: hypothetical protein AAGA62_19210, partial [Bacteroidota bacterium]